MGETKKVWGEVHNPEKPYVPIDEAPDANPDLNPEQRMVLLDLYEKGLLKDEERALAEEWLGIVNDEAPKVPARSEVEVHQEMEAPGQESEAAGAYERAAADNAKSERAARAALLGKLNREKPGHGTNKRDWKSFSGPAPRDTIRKPPEDDGRDRA